ncbi:hypothetical protein HRR83_001036 [Exophiala dermatitidis]|uniref:Uncharacterized protein n=2 Tax=Exophiala dermatitidis TaxID=5970 RepID=H6C7J4_EXODN|nr:uncharacterized protein HMPREF1120_07673 [Exophiala dermatitidis NIH/UT8656]KAJ4525847.1 hypothetical protein HRR74_001040 [Exophiala dermatitidis]EHY59690.1 hypothetical protein HMPREF1120_07673 [Exophiala dermatitidis NIH/UT8656]KAJ4527208.1 hypothetical protein HRR73_002005 [Exophiala dermatitidis]KAJ4532932.1 hypothetical protein HRR76_007906 [Exophiala dermatitidis]KAJ4538798.1 hypothetical protein HRR77_006725 [Exophiala dermatitidis]
MESRVKVWTFASLASGFSTAMSVLDLIIALGIIDLAVLPVLRILLLVAFGINILNLAVLAYLSTFYVKDLNNYSLGSRTEAWAVLAGGVVAAMASMGVSGVVWVWLVLRRNELPHRIFRVAPITLVSVGVGTWGLSIIMQVVLFCLLCSWTKSVLKTRRASRLDLDFGIRIPSMSTARRTSAPQISASFCSQAPTINSTPSTPVSRKIRSPPGSSSTRIGTGSSRNKIIRHSNQSSVEASPLPVGEAITTDSAFDQWDTSSVHREMRAVLDSSPPLTRSGLETIPGSRPDSPANALDGPFLPETPASSPPPRAATSSSPTAVEWSSSPRQLGSSPPSSPPNFSLPRPSLYYHKSPPKPQRREPSPHELVHPLFRPTSPGPPPIPLGQTMVTVPPLAEHLVSPQTIRRQRSQGAVSFGHHKAFSSSDRSESQSVEDNFSESETKRSPSLGSPGPSIVDEDELPPILPGFVLSAGSRTSLVGYGKRKGLRQGYSRSQEPIVHEVHDSDGGFI